jgi:uncharacterized cupin superfamily protein
MWSHVMPTVRRVVTGVDADGHAVVASDGPAPTTHDFVHVPGMGTTLVWATVRPASLSGSLPGGSADPTVDLRGDLPAPGETRFVIVQFPPDAVFGDEHFDPRAAEAEQRRVSPDLAATFEAAEPGMHTTNTTDYAVILSGSIQLELDNGVLVPLNPGDTVVQNGTRHAWRNGSPDVAVVAFVNIGPWPGTQG